ncbi:MAG TPA: EamA family transporter [Chloroflexi bacterium]|nr:EamA family transporter [Chloroflexota bacterium]
MPDRAPPGMLCQRLIPDHLRGHMGAYLGHIAALATSVAWSFTSVFFTLSGRQVGSAVVNRTRLLLALVFVTLMHRMTQGQFFPLDAEPFRWGWLALSGLIGFVVGDAFLFQAFVMIGPRLTMLLMALTPVFSTALGWVLLREALTPLELAGVVLAVGGVALVVSGDSNGNDDPEEEDSRGEVLHIRHYTLGVLFGLGAAIGQAGGLFASRMGLVGDFPALSGNLIRLIAATIAIWVMAFLRRQAGVNFEKLRAHPRAFLTIVGGALLGPFVGVWLSLIAVQKAPLGIASTLMSLSPIVLLPVGRVLFNERIGLRAVGGTVMAVAGSALLFL